MKRLLLFFAALLLAAPVCLADEGDEEVITFPVYDIGEVRLGHKYDTHRYEGLAATLHVNEDGLLRVMCTSGDYPAPYADAAHTQMLDFLASFYEGSQGYVINVSKGDVIYFFKSFCMGDSKVWFEMQTQQLEFKSSPAVGERLVPTGRAQLELDFNMPVVTSGGTMKCGGQSVSLEARSASLYILYEIKDIVMRWIESGIPAGTPIDVTITGVHAAVNESIKYGTDGTINLRFRLPSMPGKLVSNNIEDLTFKSYWLPDDPEGLLRMTFSKPVSTENPGYLSIVYGNAEAMDVNQLTFNGKADGYDVVYDLRDIYFRPKDLLDSGNLYPSIMLRPGGVYDADGDLMYSPGIGTLASWTYEIPYMYLYGNPSWEVTDENENNIVRLDSGDGVLLYVYYYNLVRSDGILLTFDDGETVTIPFSDVEINWESNGSTAELFFEIPEVYNCSERVTISFANMRLLTGEKDPGTLKKSFPWTPSIQTGVDAVPAAAVLRPAYDLGGRRVSFGQKGILVSRDRKEVR